VLLVADAELKAEIMSRLTEHYQIVDAADEHRGALQVRDERPDMVVAQASQSAATLAFVEKLKADPDLRAIPVMVICEPSQTSAVRGTAHPPDDVVSRAAGIATICARVRANVELGRLRASSREQQQLLARTRQEVIRRLLAAEESERARLARELHDGIGQMLTACRLLLPQLRNQAAEPLHATIGMLEQLTSDIARDLHRVAATLRPTALDDLGLAATLESYLAEWSASTGIAATSHFSRIDGKRSIVVETTVYRIVQEILRNVAKHTQAKNVALVAEETDGLLSIIVEDDGAGFDLETELAAKPTSWGIAAMQERAALIGGDLKIESTAGQGTTVYLRVPIAVSE
jgi:signal transduction histidine kinase